ncbi:MAG: hypothetical protein AAF617_14520 [Bacteroidota bacterium]
MQFSSVLGYFLSVTIYTLLAYNFLTTVLFCWKKQLLSGNSNVRKLQQYVLVLMLICMIAYYKMTVVAAHNLSILPWIWGFLSGHLFSTLEKRWLNELFGLGILLAITIVLFFKQIEIIQLCTTLEITAIATTVYFIYMSAGFMLGSLLWSNTIYK